MIKKFTLAEREIEALNYVKFGKDNHAIADLMDISIYTVKAYISSILRKLNAKTRTEAVIKAIQLGIIDLF